MAPGAGRQRGAGSGPGQDQDRAGIIDHGPRPSARAAAQQMLASDSHRATLNPAAGKTAEGCEGRRLPARAARPASAGRASAPAADQRALWVQEASRPRPRRARPPGQPRQQHPRAAKDVGLHQRRARSHDDEKREQGRQVEGPLDGHAGQSDGYRDSKLSGGQAARANSPMRAKSTLLTASPMASRRKSSQSDPARP